MRQRKPGDSPSNYDREVRPKLRVVRPREWPSGPLGDALHAVSVRWTAVLAEQAMQAQPSPILWDKERLASRIYTLAHAVSFEDAERRAEMFAEIAVFALAGVVQSEGAAMLDPASGDAA